MNKSTYRFFGLKLSYDKDADLISFLESQENIQGKVKEILNKHIDKMSGKAGEWKNG